MKQLSIFLFAFALTAGVATAQVGSTATVNQTGNTNQAEVTQAAVSTASVTQDSYEADPTPDGYVGNEARLDQNASTATVLQSGEENVLGGIPLSPRSAFVQTGGSSLNSEQYGARNAVLGSQSGGSTATVDQNTAAYNQGEGNAIELTQADGANATIWQVFNGKDGGFYGGAEAYVDQSGGAGNNVDIYQTGDGTNATVTQSGGGGNYAEAYQRGYGASAFFTQQGMGNEAYVNQGNQVGSSIAGAGTGVDASTATVNQLSDDNIARVAQGGPNSIYATNTATVTQQTGTLNDADVRQDGDDNLATLLQDGSSNIADLLQMGLTNTANVSQTGTGHVATSTQAGNNNSSTITQN